MYARHQLCEQHILCGISEYSPYACCKTLPTQIILFTLLPPVARLVAFKGAYCDTGSTVLLITQVATVVSVVAHQ